jgi:hypothetical protein
MERTLVRPARSEWKESGAGGGWLFGGGRAMGGEEIGELFSSSGKGRWSREGLERHRRIAGVTKTSRSKLVEPAT